MVSGCVQNYARMHLGNEVDKLFEQTGVEVTKELISIINKLLDKYSEYIPMKFDSPELIGKIYSEARELYNMKSKYLRIR
jgi:hypothetical protein